MKQETLEAQKYLAIDGANMKNLIIQKLNESGVYTDQIYEGSNISSIIDVVSYAYSNLLFYLNQTASESLFTEAQIYENMNRIVQSLDYKPVGKSAAMIFPRATTTLPQGNYLIPRYTYFKLGNVFYSFANDVSILKTEEGEQHLSAMENEILFQGKFEPFPKYTASGEPFETFYLTRTEDVKIDHFNIHVYVKDMETDEWERWEETPSLYLEGGSEKKYYIRFNANKNYEIRFGNDINGKRLLEDQEVMIYYLRTIGQDGELGANVLNDIVATLFNGPEYFSILDSVLPSGINRITQPQLGLIQFSNPKPSTQFKVEESVSEIRANAPSYFSRQHRLITSKDFNSFIKEKFSNFIHDVYVCGNDEFNENHIEYLSDIGMDEPFSEPRILENLKLYSNNCHFNNVYVYGVPKYRTFETSIDSTNFLNSAQKNLILRSIQDAKVISSSIVFMDPVFMAFELGISNELGELNLNSDLTPIADTHFEVRIKRNVLWNEEAIRTKVVQIIEDRFKVQDLHMGELVDLQELNNKILEIPEILSIRTVNETYDRSVRGLGMVVYNPVYRSDATYVSASIDLKPFQFPFYSNIKGFSKKIKFIQ